MDGNTAGSAASTPLHTWEVLVEGRVQGVGYRYSVHQWACELGVTGWVRNEYDGNVRAVLQHCDPEVLSELAARLRQGPPQAFVLNLEITPVDADAVECFRGFAIRR